VIICPNCGTQNEPGSRFCAECGADLRTLQAVPEPTPQPSTPPIPPQYDLGAPPAPSGAGWAPGSDFRPPPEKKRRIWLWIVVGILAACLIFCCATSVWATTDSGQEFVDDLGTRLADYQTETAR